MIPQIKFELRPEHVKLLSSAYVYWEGGEFGAPSIDCKRPYGNSSVIEDIAEILGLEQFEDADGEKHLSKEQVELCEKLHGETEQALQIVLSTKSFEPGIYVREQYEQTSWTKEKIR